MRTPDVEVFACSCGQERTDIWDALMAEVAAELQVEVDHLLDAVVYGLIRYSAAITGIAADQWALIGAATFDDAFVVRIDCDRLEHGLAAVWRAFTERFPEGHYTPPADADDGEDDDDG